jgi:hydroxymethylpyrimidine pyrophosphatase-like HAD family hydrolase
MNAYFFDVDGVLSNNQFAVSKEIIAKLAQILIDENVLALISGRSFDTQIKMVVEPLEAYVAKHSPQSSKFIDNLFISAEFGGASLYHKNGKRIGSVDKLVALPQELRNQLTKAAEPYLDIVNVEADKQTMYSSPKKPQADLKSFTKVKPELVATYEKILADYPKFKVLTDRYSVNVKHINANKRFGTEHVLEWLIKKRLQPQQYYAFGDSVSDLEIGEALFARDLPMEFIFVGERHELDGLTITFPYIITNEDFDLGTLEYLEK